MTVDVRCDACGGTFQVAQSGGAPTSAACPYCRNTVTVPAAPDETPTEATAPQGYSPSADRWHVYTCDGQRFGPITKEEIDRWAAEKRLTSSCQLYQDGWPAWRMAHEFYPNLPAASGAALPGPAAAAPNLPSLGAGAAGSGGTQNPYAAPMYAGGGSFSGMANQAPHRGALILVFGILGWVICCAFGLPALIMGYIDLGKMKSGEMDNSGYGMTMAGFVLAILQFAIFGLFIVLWLVFAGVSATGPKF